MLAKVLTAKVAIGATVIFLGAGTAAAALSGTLPFHATSHADSHAKAGLATATSHLPVSTAASSQSSSSQSSSAAGKSTTNGSIPSSGVANSHALFGLCTAFLAGNTSGTTSGRNASTAFKALIAETGGSTSATKTFCKNYVLADHPGGKPSSGAKSSSHARVTTPDGGGTGTANQASGGASSSGTSTADQASGGASSAGSGNAGSRPGSR